MPRHYLHFLLGLEVVTFNLLYALVEYGVGHHQTADLLQQSADLRLRRVKFSLEAGYVPLVQSLLFVTTHTTQISLLS